MLALRSSHDGNEYLLRLREMFRRDPRSIRDNRGRFGVFRRHFGKTALGLLRGVTDFFSIFLIFVFLLGLARGVTDFFSKEPDEYLNTCFYVILAAIACRFTQRVTAAHI